MQVHTDIEHLPLFNKAVVTIGTFDGVHLGHKKIIYQLKKEAERLGGETIIITFHPHPRKIVRSANTPLELLTTIEERIHLLASLGIDHLVVVPFTQSFSRLSPSQYIEDFLVKRFHPHTVIIGYDHRFGKERSGDFRLMEKYGSLFQLLEIPEHVIADSTVSSTVIRQSLREGNIDLVNRLLGYAYYFDGLVVRGDQRGRTIGFPTANLSLRQEEKMLPANGVYAVEVTLAGHNKKLPGMMNIGFRPTVDGSKKTIEVHIFDFEEDIYGRVLQVTVLRRIRPEQKFSGIEELRDQLEKDRINVKDGV